MEDSKTDDEQDDCGGDLEDGLFNANRKGECSFQTVQNFIKREKLRRNPCSLFEKLRGADRCKIEVEDDDDRCKVHLK